MRLVVGVDFSIKVAALTQLVRAAEKQSCRKAYFRFSSDHAVLGTHVTS